MADEPKYTREIRDGIEVLVYPDGTVKRASDGAFMHPPNKAIIRSSERGKELAQIKKEKGTLAQLRALAKGTGVELPEDAELDQLVEQASSGLEALTLHFFQQFMKSSNIRGMAESYGKLAAPLVGDRSEPAQVAHTINNFHMPENVMEFFIAVKKRMDEQDKPEVIDAETDAWQKHSPWTG